jgi:uncharacterized membrane protein
MTISVKSIRGSILLTTLCFIIVVAMVVCAVYDLSLRSYKLSQRNEYLTRAKMLADSELD